MEAVLGAAEARLYLWFFPGSMGRGVGASSAVKWSEAARALVLSGTNVGGSKGVDVGDNRLRGKQQTVSVSRGVNVGDGSTRVRRRLASASLLSGWRR